MDLAALEDALLSVAARAGVAVRWEPFDPVLFQQFRGRGGLCRLHGQRVIMADHALSRPDRIGVLADALSRLDLEAISMAPAVRDLIGRYAGDREREAAARRPRLRRVV